MLIFKFINFIMGYCKVDCAPHFAKQALNLMLQNEIDYWDMKRSESGGLEFFILNRELKRLLSAAGNGAACFKKIDEKGLFSILKRYRKRIGIPIGLCIFTAILWSSTLFVWDIRVSGNRTVTDSEIVKKLDSLGCSIGSFIPDINFYSLCNRYVMENQNIAWIAVNIDGTTAEVRVIEADIPESEEENHGTPTNIVAARDGFIVRIELEEGMAVVKQGQTVKEGELLVSGINDVEYYSRKFKLVHSKARVMAETHRTLEISVPLVTEQKAATGRSFEEKAVRVFGKTINIGEKVSENSSILKDNCDIIENEKRVILFENDLKLFGKPVISSITLPIYVLSSSYNEFESKEKIITKEEAEAICYKLLANKMKDELGDAEILTRDVKVFYDTDENGAESVRLVCELDLIEDIAKQSVIGIKGSQND